MSNDPDQTQGPVGGRKEQGSASDSPRHRPHVSEAADEARLQENQSSPDDVPVRPPNAQGTGKRTVEREEQGIDEGSMYDRRPSEDKDRPPSSPATP